MRILHVTEVSDGGVAAYVDRMSDVQRRRGHEVRRLSPSGGPLGSQWSFARGAPVGWPRARAALAAELARVQPDVVHAHSFFAGLLARTLSTGSRGDAALVYQPHAWAVDAVRSKTGRAVVAGWERRASRRTDAVIYVSHGERRQGDGIGVTAPGHVVGVPVDLARYRPADDGERLRARRGLGLDARRLVVCVGRLSYQKAQDELARAWERRPIADATLVLVGPGDSRIVRTEAPRTFGATLLHVGARSDVPVWLSAADAMVQSSRYEGMSTAVGEGLAAGLPVFSTAVNGAYDAIEDPDLGPAAGAVRADVAAVLREAGACLDDPPRLAAQAAAAPIRARALYDAERVADRIDAAYASVLRG